MVGLIIIGIIIAIVAFRHLKMNGFFAEEIDTGLNDPIKLNEIKAEMAQQTGSGDDKKVQENICVNHSNTRIPLSFSVP